MERKIGEIKQVNGEWFQCVEQPEKYDKTVCNLCDFHGIGNCELDRCSGTYRSDKKDVIFKKLEKVGGEPLKIHNRLVLKVKADAYNCMRCCFYSKAKCELTMQECEHYDCGEGTKFIEIKQNKENMEEKKLNLKPFDIQKAREGKPVCTRDGRKARIICFDRKFYHDGYNYPIVAMVNDNDNDNDNELVHAYTQDGLLVGNAECELDLMMLPEKRSGWVNVYKGSVCISVYPRIYKSREEAISDNTAVNRIDTVKISWEE